MNTYSLIVFFQENQAAEGFAILKQQGSEELYKYLSKWDYNEHDTEDIYRHRFGDESEVFGSYMVVYNFYTESIALYKLND